MLGPAARPASCRTLRFRRLRTRSYRPQTNGEAERFIRTLRSDSPIAGSRADGHGMMLERNNEETPGVLERWVAERLG